MILRKALARTGVEIPEIGLGSWRYSGGVAPLRLGIELGAAFIDTAESYGSEPIIAEAIRGLRDQVFLATKVSRQHLRREALIRACDQSLQRLRVDHVDLYQVHEPNRDIPLEETFGALEELVDAGKVRFIGVSNFSVAQLQAAQRALRQHPIVSNQVRYNLIDRTIESALLPYCAAHSVTVIAYSPLARGLRQLVDADPDGVLRQMASRTGKSVAQIALNWCLRHPAAMVIPKASSLEHVRDVCGASGWRLDPEEARRLDEGVRFRRRSALESALRQALPRGWGRVLRPLVQRLPPSLRRRLQ